MDVRYFPVEVPWSPKPGLEKLGSKDHGNGDFDKKVFQIEPDTLDKYLELKKEQYSEQPYVVEDLSEEVLNASSDKIYSLLAEEYPHYFTLDNNSISCYRIKQTIPRFGGLVHFIENCIQEDIVIFSGEDKMVFAHVCFPSGWDPGEKIGKSFAEIHAPVPGIEQINKNACKHVKLMVNTPTPLVRYIWGMRVGRGLNEDDLVNKDAFFMTERQCIIGLPEVNASIFTIRVRVEPLKKMNISEKNILKEVMNNMNQDELEYKGFNHPVIKEILYV
jgi:dimethylamine monooxygenase subunit A